MNGIASLLDAPANSRVEQIWQELEATCGLKGIRMTPFPHITWQVTEGYDLPILGEVLRNFSHRTQPFTIHTDGLGIFTGRNPVIYISIFKDEFLMRLHSDLWELTKGFAKDPDVQYAPSRWIPHITLAFNDLNRENLNCAIQKLAFQSFDWSITIDNFIYMTQEGEQTAETGKYQLGT